MKLSEEFDDPWLVAVYDALNPELVLVARR
jgi:hypothetical protein